MIVLAPVNRLVRRSVTLPAENSLYCPKVFLAGVAVMVWFLYWLIWSLVFFLPWLKLFLPRPLATTPNARGFVNWMQENKAKIKLLFAF